MHSTPPKAERPRAPGEPAVIQRLPEGVDYTHIKAIFLDLPASITTLLWMAEPADHLAAAFRGKTIRAIERTLRRHEQNSADLERSRLIRHELVQLCYQELSRSSSRHGLSIEVRHVIPQLFREGHRPPGPAAPHVHITVRRIPGRRDQRATAASSTLDERTIASEPAVWNASIPWIDQDRVDRAFLELVRKHFPELMRVRVGARWRSNYPSEGWQIITRYAVPMLYELLRPFYRVRPYRNAWQTAPAGHYSARLRQDITDIVRLELPHLARNLTVARVTAAIQRHIKREQARKRRRKKRPEE
jgi:hypothetical protein